MVLAVGSLVSATKSKIVLNPSTDVQGVLNLSNILPCKKLLSIFNDFNYFHTFYFCLGHVLGTRIREIVRVLTCRGNHSATVADPPRT